MAREVIEVARAALEALEATEEVIEVPLVEAISQLPIKTVTRRSLPLLLNES